MSSLCVCVIGLGGGGFHAEAQRIVGAVKRSMELVLVYSGPHGGVIHWDARNVVRSSYVLRSPSLTGDTRRAQVLGMLRNLWHAARILSTERPDVVLAVGTAQALPFGIVTRLTGTEMWFVESITRMKVPSRTGRWIYRLRLASRFYYYSRGLAKYCPNGICMENTRQ